MISKTIWTVERNKSMDPNFRREQFIGPSVRIVF